MRAKEFIFESTPEGKIPKRLARSGQGITRMRDPGGIDRGYHLNRIWMAAAMADGKSDAPVDMDSSSFSEKYSLAVPFTKEEHNMMLSAMNTIPTDSKELMAHSKSEESPTVNKVSPVPNWMKKS